MSQVDAADALDLLLSRMDKSLVVCEEDAQGRGRYRLLETVKQYGKDRLIESGEERTVRGRHQGFFLTWAEQVEPEMIAPGRRSGCIGRKRNITTCGLPGRLAQQRGQRLNLAAARESFGGMAHDLKQWVQAARLLAAAEFQRRTLGHIPEAGNQREHHRRMDSVREAPGEDDFAAAAADGQAMTLEEAAEYAPTDE